MDEMQAKEEIQLIKAMLEKTKKATAESGTLFILRGKYKEEQAAK